ncbi:unnamed protein product [Arctogadus glacialis]
MGEHRVFVFPLAGGPLERGVSGLVVVVPGGRAPPPGWPAKLSTWSVASDGSSMGRGGGGGDIGTHFSTYQNVLKWTPPPSPLPPGSFEEFPCVVEMAAAQRSAQTNKGVEVKGEPQCGRADCLG